MVWFISPISSRKIVPPWASSNLPFFIESAPVKAPFSCPKSSLSRRVSLKAAQCTFTKDFSLRPERLCRASATSSFPTPLSPVIRTLALDGATFFISSRRRLMSALVPIILSNVTASPSSFLSIVCCRESSLFSRARFTITFSWSRFNGLVRKSYAPFFIASTAESMLPCPVSTITGIPGVSVVMRLRTSSPLIPSILRSVTTRSMSPFETMESPSFPLEAVFTL